MDGCRTKAGYRLEPGREKATFLRWRAMERQPVKDACVLIVDDEPANVLLLERLLEVSDFTNVTSTMDSSEVVSLCTSLDPDLIVLDLQMPDPDGVRGDGRGSRRGSRGRPSSPCWWRQPTSTPRPSDARSRPARATS